MGIDDSLKSLLNLILEIYVGGHILLVLSTSELSLEFVLKLVLVALMTAAKCRERLIFRWLLIGHLLNHNELLLLLSLIITVSYTHLTLPTKRIV